MPRVDVVFFADADGDAPALAWLDGLPQKVKYKFIARMERLAASGGALRRPHASILRDGIYELRVRHMRVHYRMLYFFHGQRAVLASGLKKTDRVPDREIDRAVGRMNAFARAPRRHTYME